MVAMVPLSYYKTSYLPTAALQESDGNPGMFSR